MNNKLKKLEDKLNIATDIIQEIDTTDIIPFDNCIEDIKPTIETVNNEELFTFENLKKDFMLIRNNVLSLITKGQNILEKVGLLDISDLKATQIQAISNMHDTLGNNLKLLIDLYKQIADIECLRSKKSGKFNSEQPNQQISSGNTVNNQIVFAGNTDDLLKLIKDNQIINN